MKYIILIVVALAVAFGAITMMGKAKPAPVIDESKFVLVATMDLLPGQFIISGQHVTFVEMQESDIKPNFMRKKDNPPSLYEGAVVRGKIKAGEPIQREQIFAPKDGGFLSAVLYPGMRAVSVGVDAISANAGFIFPGDRVDLLLTHEVTGLDGKQSFATETFLEDVRVLAVDQQVNNPNNQATVPKTVTLEVKPKQAEEVLVAAQLGKISLVLRSVGSSSDTANEEKTFTTDNDVSKILDKSRNGNTVTVTRGKDTVTINSEETNQGQSSEQ